MKKKKLRSDILEFALQDGYNIKNNQCTVRLGKYYSIDDDGYIQDIKWEYIKIPSRSYWKIIYGEVTAQVAARYIRIIQNKLNKQFNHESI